MWYSWTDETSFNDWHAATCGMLGIPRPGVNAATGEVDESAQWTTAYTAVVEVGPGDWRAIVESDVVAMNPTGLGQPSDPPPTPEIEVNSIDGN